jgi:hypothetical protein
LARCGGVGEYQRAHAAVPAEEDQSQEAAGHGAVDPQPSVPDFEDAGDGVARVEIVVGDDVVDTRPNKAEGDDEEE